jgi:hypothetical protein
VLLDGGAQTVALGVVVDDDQKVDRCDLGRSRALGHEAPPSRAFVAAVAASISSRDALRARSVAP